MNHVVVAHAAEQDGFVEVRAAYLLDVLNELELLRQRLATYDRLLARYVDDAELRDFDADLWGGGVKELVRDVSTINEEEPPK